MNEGVLMKFLNYEQVSFVETGSKGLCKIIWINLWNCIINLFGLGKVGFIVVGQV